MAFHFILPLLLFLKEVGGEFMLRLQLTEFSNPFPARDSTSYCCSGSLPFCSRSCHPHFEVCYKGNSTAGSCLETLQTETFSVPPAVTHTLIFNDTDALFNFKFNAYGSFPVMDKIV
jgi:hypothetical protein